MIFERIIFVSNVLCVKVHTQASESFENVHTFVEQSHLKL